MVSVHNEDSKSCSSNTGIMPVVVYKFHELSKPELGERVHFAGRRWIVQHLEDDYAYLAFDGILGKVPFGKTADYGESELRKHCKELEREMGPYMRYCAEGNDHNDRVFAPTVDQYKSEWDWPSRGAVNRVVKDKDGYPTWYWTSSPFDSTAAWNVLSYGAFDLYTMTETCGFRPAVKVRCM